MAKKKMEHIKEYYEHRVNSHNINDEKVLMNDRKLFPYEVYVYGNEVGNPCFYFSKKDVFDFKLVIPSTTDWNTEKDLKIIKGIYQSDHIQKSIIDWTTFLLDKQKLIIWLDKTDELDADFTNLESLRFFYNSINNENEKTHDIK